MKTLSIAAIALLISLTACAPDKSQGYPPCITEDQEFSCYWDAAKHGNGLGQSFIVNADGTVTYTR